MEKFTVWILNELSKRNWKPADLAHKAGVSTGALSNVLNGNRKAGPEFCRAIAKALGEPEEKIFRLAGLLSPLKTPEDEITLQEIWDMVKSMSVEQREEVLNYVKYLYQKKNKD